MKNAECKLKIWLKKQKWVLCKFCFYKFRIDEPDLAPIPIPQKKIKENKRERERERGKKKNILED